MKTGMQLVAISGPLKGDSWPLGEAPVVLGRDIQSDIRLYAPLASRRHCALHHEGDRVRLEELSARNPVLVNGRPMRGGELRLGDTLSIGEDVFLLSHVPQPPQLTSDGPQDGDTVSLGDCLSARWDERVRNDDTPLPSTSEQLAFLFDTAHGLSKCHSRTEALSFLDERLQLAFRPDAAWFVRTPQEGAKLRFQRLSGEATSGAIPPSGKVVRAVLRAGQGAIVQHGGAQEGEGSCWSSVVVPFCAAGVSLGAVVLQRGPEHAAYEGGDSAFLDVIARACTPFLHMAETIGYLEHENTRLRRRAGEASELVGDSAVMRELRQEVDKASQTGLNVLLRGETGTGKEVAARILHARSPRKEGPFVVVNCAAIPDELFESQVFGHRAGAFTGAQGAFEGLFSQADGGTLFLDEVGDLSSSNQARILRAVELGAFRPLGAPEEVQVDVRVVSATNKDLAGLLSEGRFRQDFFHRLSGFYLELPPLSHRTEDIPLLARHFFDVARDTARHPLEGIAEDALEFLAQRAWPGNVRELRNAVLRAVGIARGPLIQVEDLRRPGPFIPNVSSDDRLETWEKEHIAAILARHGGKVPEAAQALGIARSTLYKKIAAYGLAP